MGRTGRHKEGRVVYILAAGREADKYNQIMEVQGIGHVGLGAEGKVAEGQGAAAQAALGLR